MITDKEAALAQKHAKHMLDCVRVHIDKTIDRSNGTYIDGLHLAKRIIEVHLLALEDDYKKKIIYVPKEA